MNWSPYLPFALLLFAALGVFMKYNGNPRLGMAVYSFAGLGAIVIAVLLNTPSSGL